MDAEFLRTTVGDRLAKAVAAAAESGADDKVEYIADWLLNQVSVEEAGVAAPVDLDSNSDQVEMGIVYEDAVRAVGTQQTQQLHLG